MMREDEARKKIIASVKMSIVTHAAKEGKGKDKRACYYLDILAFCHGFWAAHGVLVHPEKVVRDLRNEYPYMHIVPLPLLKHEPLNTLLRLFKNHRERKYVEREEDIFAVDGGHLDHDHHAAGGGGQDDGGADRDRIVPVADGHGGEVQDETGGGEDGAS